MDRLGIQLLDGMVSVCSFSKVFKFTPQQHVNRDILDSFGKSGKSFTQALLVTSINSDLMVLQTSQELRMLSIVTPYCQVTKIVMNSGSQLSELQSVSQMS